VESEPRPGKIHSINGAATLVDSSVLLDVLTEDPTWAAWSEDALADAADMIFVC
jgi:hypothetical protein